jgi:hypothetical protein
MAHWDGSLGTPKKDFSSDTRSLAFSLIEAHG